MRRHPSATIPSRLAAVVVAALVVASCGSDGSSSDTTGPDDPETTDTGTSVPETTAPATTAPATTVASTAAATTTAPATTAPATTAPATTGPATVAPATTAPAPSDEELAQFCFDSEQVYVSDVVMSEIGEATPAQVRAATASLVHWVDVAVDSAPPGFTDEPLAAQAALEELVAIFDEHDYDANAILSSPDADRATALIVDFDAVMSGLQDFLLEVCNSQFVVLNSQAQKFAAVIDEAVTWPLTIVTNVAGDIRLLVPPEWSDWLGSTDVEEVTFLRASPDNAQYDADWTVPGVDATVAYVEIGVADPETRLGPTRAAQDCEPVASEPYSDPVYSGTLHLFESCGGTSTSAAVLLATDDGSQSVEIVLEFQFPEGPDRELLDQMLATFAAGA